MRRFVLPVAIIAIAVLASVATAADRLPGNGIQSFDHAKAPFLAPQANACLDVSVELLPGPGQAGSYTKTVSSEIMNCGDEASFVTVTVTLNGFDVPISVTHYVYLAAGESLVRNMVFPTMVPLPPGDYEICVDASAGDASASDCATYTVSP